MSNSGACHIIVVLMATLLAAAPSSVSAAGRETTSVFTREDGIRIAGYGEEKLSTVILTGTLLCSSCLVHQLQLLPISGALVAATCNSNTHHITGNNKPSWIIKGITNKNGKFMIDMPSHLHWIPDLHKACSVKVLRLPKHSPCRSAAKHRSHELVLSSVGNGIRTYSARTLHFENTKGCKRESHGSY